jgi:hypothetical protein
MGQVTGAVRRCPCHVACVPERRKSSTPLLPPPAPLTTRPFALSFHTSLGPSPPLRAPNPQAERFVGRLDKVGCVAGDLGLALFKLAKFEEAEGGPLATSSGEPGGGGGGGDQREEGRGPDQ